MATSSLFLVYVFQKIFAYMMSHKLLPLMRILDISNSSITTFITRGNISLEVLLTYSMPKNPRACLSGFSVEVVPSSLLTTINSTIILLMVPLEELLGLRKPSVIEVMYWSFPLGYSFSSLLLSYFPIALATAVIAFLEVDFLLQGEHLFLTLRIL